MNIIGKAEKLELNEFYIMEIVLIDTTNPKVRIKILMTGTKLAACHQKMADCDSGSLFKTGTELENTNLCLI